MDKFENIFLKNHNEVRQKYQLHPLKMDGNLTRYAWVHIQELLDNQSVYHGNIPEKSLQNIASGKKNLLKENVCVNLWINDPAHRAPIINKMFTKIGFAHHIDNDNNVIIVCNYS